MRPTPQSKNNKMRMCDSGGGEFTYASSTVEPTSSVCGIGLGDPADHRQAGETKNAVGGSSMFLAGSSSCSGADNAVCLGCGVSRTPAEEAKGCMQAKPVVCFLPSPSISKLSIGCAEVNDGAKRVGLGSAIT